MSSSQEKKIKLLFLVVGVIITIVYGLYIFGYLGNINRQKVFVSTQQFSNSKDNIERSWYKLEL